MSDSPETIEIQRMHMAYDIANTHQGTAADLAAKFLEQTLATWVGTETVAGAPNDWQKITDALSSIKKLIDLGSDYTVNIETDIGTATMRMIYYNAEGVPVVSRIMTDEETEQRIRKEDDYRNRGMWAAGFLCRNLVGKVPGFKCVKFIPGVDLVVIATNPKAEECVPAMCCGLRVTVSDTEMTIDHAGRE